MQNEHQCPKGTSTYTVVSGDSVESIAQRFGVSLYDLRVLNPEATYVQLGDVLCVPTRNCMGGLVPYIVKPGDTVSRIARRTLTTPRILAHLNRMPRLEELEVGQVICVPQSGEDAEREAAAGVPGVSGTREAPGASGALKRRRKGG